MSIFSNDNDSVRPVILEPTGDSAKNLVIHGERFDATLSSDGSPTTSVFNMSFAEDRDLQGVSVQVCGHVDGDAMRLAIVHPVTQDEIRVLGCGGGEGGGLPLSPDGIVGVVSEGTATVPAGVILRLTFITTKEDELKPSIFVQLRQWI